MFRINKRIAMQIIVHIFAKNSTAHPFTPFIRWRVHSSGTGSK